NFKREKNALKQALFSLFYIPNCQKREYTNKFLISMQMNTKKTNKKLKLNPPINIILYKLKKPGEMSISIGFFV
ncbi:hypothetical protein, partial [Catenibacterium sp.]|uniref:hypothetical protein n=1 Tax=Catenibacterium sp. TaxID=2049022 RepID=UPI002E778634